MGMIDTVITIHNDSAPSDRRKPFSHRGFSGHTHSVTLTRAPVARARHTYSSRAAARQRRQRPTTLKCVMRYAKYFKEIEMRSPSQIYIPSRRRRRRQRRRRRGGGDGRGENVRRRSPGMVRTALQKGHFHFSEIRQFDITRGCKCFNLVRIF